MARVFAAPKEELAEWVERFVRIFGKRPEEIKSVEDLERLVGREGDINSADELERLFRLE